MTTSSLSQIRQQLSSFHFVSDKQKQIKAVLDVSVNANLQRANEKIRNDLKEDLSTELSYYDGSPKGLIILFRIVRDYLLRKEIQYGWNPENQRIMVGLVNCFFDPDSNENYAWERIATAKSPVVPELLSEFVSVRTIDSGDDCRIAHNRESWFEKVITS